MKYTRIAYAEQGVREVLKEVVNDASLDDLPAFNSALWSRPASDRIKVRVTVTVERVKTATRKPRRPAMPGRAAGGFAAAAGMTATERSERARKGAAARWGGRIARRA